MKRLQSAESCTYQLEVGECDCGYHFGVDATYLEQVGDFVFQCPSCHRAFDTSVVFPEDTGDEKEEPSDACPEPERAGYASNRAAGHVRYTPGQDQPGTPAAGLRGSAGSAAASLRELRRRAPKAKPGWRLQGEDCPECGEPMAATVVSTGMAWLPEWYCEKCRSYGKRIAWPFTTDEACEADWASVGIRVRR